MSNDGIKQFRDFLSRQGLRLTLQRQLIARIFLKRPGHLSVEELYRLAQLKNPSIGFATVYRTMRLLSEAGLAAGRRFGEPYARYETSRRQEHHDHLICTRCGRILEFENERIESLQEHVARKHGFQITRHKLELYGLCRKCRKKK